MKYNLGDLNLEKVRLFLQDYYESAYFVGIPEAKEDWEFVKNASDEELLEFINNSTFNYELYKNKTRK